MKHVKAEEFLALFDPEVHDAIIRSARAMASTHVVCFENENLSSPHLGERTALTVGGPENTYASPQATEGQHLKDLPSQRQYPTACVSVADLEAALRPS